MPSIDLKEKLTGELKLCLFYHWSSFILNMALSCFDQKLNAVVTCQKMKAFWEQLV